MKNLKLFTALLLLTTITSNAQITKGNWMVGGDASFSSSKTESKNSTSGGFSINYISTTYYTIQLEPNIGYFIANKFVIGTKLSYTNSYTDSGNLEINNGNFSFGPYSRYYFMKEEKEFNLFIEPSYYYFTSKSLGNATGFGFKAGTVIFLNNSIGLETGLSYKNTSNDQNTNKSFFFGVGLQIHLEKK